MQINNEGIVQSTYEEIQDMLQKQSDMTLNEIANFCADLCDTHRGHLQVGDMIRQHFDLKPISVQGGKDITHDSSTVVEVNKPSHLKRVK